MKAVTAFFLVLCYLAVNHGRSLFIVLSQNIEGFKFQIKLDLIAFLKYGYLFSTHINHDFCLYSLELQRVSTAE